MDNCCTVISITQKVIHACYPAACTLQPVEQTVWLLSCAFLSRIAANSVLVRAVLVMQGQVGWKTVWWSPSQSVGKMLTLRVITVSYWSNIIILTCTCANLSHHHTILYYTILYYTILYYTILYYTILYYTILYYTILYYTILYYTILYYTILYYTIQYVRIAHKTYFACKWVIYAEKA